MTRKRKLEELEEKVSGLKRKKQILEKQLGDAKVGKEESEEKTEAIRVLQERVKEKGGMVCGMLMFLQTNSPTHNLH